MHPARSLQHAQRSAPLSMLVPREPGGLRRHTFSPGAQLIPVSLTLRFTYVRGAMCTGWRTAYAVLCAPQGAMRGQHVRGAVRKSRRPGGARWPTCLSRHLQSQVSTYPCEPQISFVVLLNADKQPAWPAVDFHSLSDESIPKAGSGALYQLISDGGGSVYSSH
eukprot:355302-Chlamydomonas_euryale.AAC.15